LREIPLCPSTLSALPIPFYGKRREQFHSDDYTITPINLHFRAARFHPVSFVVNSDVFIGPGISLSWSQAKSGFPVANIFYKKQDGPFNLSFRFAREGLDP